MTERLSLIIRACKHTFGIISRHSFIILLVSGGIKPQVAEKFGIVHFVCFLFCFVFLAVSFLCKFHSKIKIQQVMIAMMMLMMMMMMMIMITIVRKQT